jgi:hypothetical protein
MGQSRVDTMTRLAAANPPFDAKRLSNYMISIFPIDGMLFHRPSN